MHPMGDENMVTVQV